MKQLAFASVLFLAACGGKSSTPSMQPEGSGDGVEETTEPTAEIVTLDGIEQGDAACYINITDGAGNAATLPGSFELCEAGGMDATGLIGSKVTYTTEKANMMAGSCGGDPECPDTEEVDMVNAITAAE